MKLNQMKKLFLLAVLCFVSSQAAFSQDDDTIQFIHGLPETGEDTSQQLPQQDAPPADREVEVTLQQLPSALRETLAERPEYKGWQKATITLQKNTGYYIISIADSVRVRQFLLDKDGNQLSMNEKTRSDRRP
jgi:hypothetical protein